MRWNHVLVKLQDKFFHSVCLLKTLSSYLCSSNLEKPPFNWGCRLTSLQSCRLTGCNVIKNEVLTKFLKDVLKIS